MDKNFTKQERKAPTELQHDQNLFKDSSQRKYPNNSGKRILLL